MLPAAAFPVVAISEALAANSVALERLLATAKRDLERSRLTALQQYLPDALPAADAAVDTARSAARPRTAAIVSRLHTIWAHAAYRTSNESAAADAVTVALDYAEAAADPVAATEARRVEGVLARRSGDPDATAIMTAAADALAVAGLTSAERLTTWAETRASAAYTAAGHFRLDDADTLLAETRDRLVASTIRAAFTTVEVDVFATSAAMHAGEFDLALHRAERVNVARISTRHQAAHAAKNVAVAATACGDAAAAVAALERIDQIASDFLNFRPWAASLAADLIGSPHGGTSATVRRLYDAYGRDSR